MLLEAGVSEPGQSSFRDPGGRVYCLGGRILREVDRSHDVVLREFLGTGAAVSAIASGRLVRSQRLARSESVACEPASRSVSGTGMVWEHERIPFPSYPYEWPAEMLHSAAGCTLDLAEAALEDGFGLKDATPYNVLFRGPQPVFVDVLSFEKRRPLDPSWLAYAQFVRTFLLPLAAHRYLAMEASELLASQRDGVEPEKIYEWARWRRRLSPPLLGLVTLPKWLSGRGRNPQVDYRPKSAPSPEQARFVLSGLLRSCRRQLQALAPRKPADSTWTGYLDHKSLYSPAQLEQKERFVRQALEEVRPSRVLDVGANEGRFSLFAAAHGAEVVAVDTDPAVAGEIWRTAQARDANVLPLVVDIARPTPATGWRNRECPSFLDRAAAHFDLVMMLAVVHHILVTERIPLDDLLALAGELSRDYMLIEYVAPEDPMFQRIVRGRGDLYAHYSRNWFEATAASRFELVRSEQVEGLHRWLYLFRRRRAAN